MAQPSGPQGGRHDPPRRRGVVCPVGAASLIFFNSFFPSSRSLSRFFPLLSSFSLSSTKNNNQAIAFLRTKQQNPVVLGPVVAAYLLLALCVRRDPRAWAERRRLRVMPFVRVSPLLTMVCNTAARRGRRITSLSLLPPSVTSAVVSSVSSSLLSPLSSVSPFSSLLASASAAAPPPSLPFPSPFSPSPPVPSQSINWISFFLKIPRVYAVAIPGLGILLPPKQHALATLACAFLIVASVGPAASDREAIFGREAHEAVARALSALTRVVFGSLWPPNSAGSAASASASSAGADSSSSAVVPAVAVVSGRAATEAVMRTMQVMGCHLAWVLHDALLRRERSRFEEEEEKKRQQEEQEKQDEDDDEKNDDDDDKNSPSSSSPSPSKNRRRRQRPKKTTMRQYLDRTAGADWIIGHAAVHACGWVAVWALCELWESSGSASVFCRWWRRQRQR